MTSHDSGPSPCISCGDGMAFRLTSSRVGSPPINEAVAHEPRQPLRKHPREDGRNFMTSSTPVIGSGVAGTLSPPSARDDVFRQHLAHLIQAAL